jgi:hypothetical protein
MPPRRTQRRRNGVTTGDVVFVVEGNRHFDSYLMSLCPIIVGSVGFLSVTTSLLAEPPRTFIRTIRGGERGLAAHIGASPGAWISLPSALDELPGT